MILHVFNPEHDLALAANLSNFTAPHAGRQLRRDLGYLPALWASADDCVLVDSVQEATRAFGRLRAKAGCPPRRFVDKRQLPSLLVSRVEPWGWDAALKAFLLRNGVSETVLPTADELSKVRTLSHRRYAATLLSHLRVEGTVGEAVELSSLEDTSAFLKDYGYIVLKAPWSSSGRGLRFIGGNLTDYHLGWIRNLLASQGSVMAEPFYNKVKDFAMEFYCDGKDCTYQGLSLFHTVNGAYKGNIIASEEDKERLISRYIPVGLLTFVRQKICNVLGELFAGQYQGCLGVDMMVVRGEKGQGFLLHPCVEINLRRTMGHAALSIPPFSDGFARVMQIILTDKYKIQIRRR